MHLLFDAFHRLIWRENGRIDHETRLSPQNIFVREDGLPRWWREAGNVGPTVFHATAMLNTYHTGAAMSFLAYS